MPDNKFLISLVSSNNQRAKTNQIDSIKLIGNDLLGRLETSRVLIFSPKVECIDSAAALHQIITFNDLVMIQNLYNEDDLFYGHEFTENNHISSTELEESSVSAIYNYIKNNIKNSSVVLLVDEIWFNNFRNFCQTTRSYIQSNISVLGDYNEKLKIDEEKVFYSIEESILTDVNYYLYSDRKPFLVSSIQKLNQSEEIVTELAETLERNQENNKSLENVTSFDLDIMEKSIKDLVSEVDKLKKTINYFEDVKNTYATQPVDFTPAKISINRFFFDDNYDC